MLKRVSRFLTLGETIANYTDKCDPNPFTADTVNEDSETLRERIDSITKELQTLIPTDKSMVPLRKALGYGRKQPSEDEIQITALVAFSDQTAIHHRETADSIAIKASVLFSENRIEGVLHARQVIGELLKNETLVLHGQNISVSRELRFWLAARNSYAQFRITDKEADYYKRNQSSKKTKSSCSDIKKCIEAIPFLKPREMNNELERHGYVGQDEARKQLCMAAFRHVERIRAIHLKGCKEEDLPPKQNVLMFGPTGSGKSHLIKTLFNDILSLPTALSDATSLTAAGFVGGDIHEILVKLYLAAEKNIALAECGVFGLDEVDKIAGPSRGIHVYQGAGTNRDVGGAAVQHELLKILEEDSCVAIPSELGAIHARSQRVDFRTNNLLGVCLGAYEGLDLLNASRNSIGFGKSDESVDPSVIESLCQYGMCREFVGRFQSVVQFRPLPFPVLMEILERKTISQFRRELDLHGINLLVEPEVQHLIVDRALSLDTGARGLASAMVGLLNDACFSAYSSKRPVKGIRLYRDGDSVHYELTHPRKSKTAKKELHELLEGVA